MKNNFKQLKEKIEKGCGKKVPTVFVKGKGYSLYETCGLTLIGKTFLCPKCKAKLELLNQVEEIIKEWILNLEKNFVLTYLKGTNERIIQFNPSVKVWEKEFKGKLLGLFEGNN